MTDGSWRQTALDAARRIDAAVEAHMSEVTGEQDMYAIEYNGDTLHRYTGGFDEEQPPRWGWGPNDWQDGPQWQTREMLFDLREEAEQCLAKLGAMGAGASVIQVDRTRAYYHDRVTELHTPQYIMRFNHTAPSAEARWIVVLERYSDGFADPVVRSRCNNPNAKRWLQTALRQLQSAVYDSASGVYVKDMEKPYKYHTLEDLY